MDSNHLPSNWREEIDTSNVESEYLWEQFDATMSEIENEYHNANNVTLTNDDNDQED